MIRRTEGVLLSFQWSVVSGQFLGIVAAFDLIWAGGFRTGSSMCSLFFSPFEIWNLVLVAF